MHNNTVNVQLCYSISNNKECASEQSGAHTWPVIVHLATSIICTATINILTLLIKKPRLFSQKVMDTP